VITFNDADLLRYSRHILLPQLGIEGQRRIAAARVLVVGAGGLGCPVALYLGAAGVGHLTLVDDDRVDLTNLQRQIGHASAAVGQNKAESLANTVRAINPDIAVVAVGARYDAVQLDLAVAEASLVVDCCDNFATRHAVNRACVAARVPLVSGAAVGFAGQLAVFDPRRASSPCYHCLFPEGGDDEEIRCSENGVFGPLVGVVGSLQAHEALKVLAAIGEPLVGRLLLWDGLAADLRSLRVPRDPGCAVCGAHA
jgi:adenylyltransferase/sulfurtransferase